MENPNKLLLKTIHNQVIKAISELCHLYFDSEAQQNSERLVLCSLKFYRQCFSIFLLTLSSNIYIYLFLNSHPFFSSIWSFKINIVTKIGNFRMYFFPNYKKPLASSCHFASQLLISQSCDF